MSCHCLPIISFIMYVAMSQGHVLNEGQLDSLTRLMRRDEAETTRSQAAHTIPHGTLFSLSAQNLLAYTKMASPCLYFAGPSILAGLDIGEKNSDILTGWICKLVIDRVRGGVKFGGGTYVNSTLGIKATGLSEAEANKLVFREFQKDVVWGACCLEQVARFFAELQLTSNPDSASLAVMEIAARMREKLGPIHVAFENMANALVAYIGVWDRLHSFHTITVTAIASRSSYRMVSSQSSTPITTPSSETKSTSAHDGHKSVSDSISHTIIGKATRSSANATHHNCAAFTIVRPSEPVMLPVWLRHYSRHFTNAVFVFRHILNVTDAFGADSVAHDAELQSLVASAVGRVKFDELYGHPHGFAVNYLAHMGSVIADKLLRAGFSCVIYTDVDELIAPDPNRYPHGLAEYVTHFVRDMPNEIIRAVGHQLCHVSESEDASPALEKPIDWSQSLLAQRSYWTRHHRYDKPLLTKVVARWKPGFHTAFLPPKIDQDPDLHLFHLTDVDRDFCIERERQKFYVYDRLGAESMKHSGQNTHIKDFAKNLNNGQLCKLAKAFQVKSTGQVMDYKKTVTLDKMDPAWATVEM